eukprot:Gb_10053 [translate_table: standard]
MANVRRGNPTSKMRYEKMHPFETLSLKERDEELSTKGNAIGASPNLTCGSHTLSNIMHEPIEDSTTQRDSSGIPQVSTEGSPQGTNQSNYWQTPELTGRACRDPLVFNISTNTIQKLTRRLIRSDPRKANPQNESSIIFPTNSKSFDEILESVIKDLPKIALLEREDQTPHYVTKEEMSTNNTEDALETSNSSEILRKAQEPISLRNNPLYRWRSKMTSKGHPENYKPQQPMGNINQTNNAQEELIKVQAEKVQLELNNLMELIEHWRSSPCTNSKGEGGGVLGDPDSSINLACFGTMDFRLFTKLFMIPVNVCGIVLRVTLMLERKVITYASKNLDKGYQNWGVRTNSSVYISRVPSCILMLITISNHKVPSVFDASQSPGVACGQKEAGKAGSRHDRGQLLPITLIVAVFLG